MNAAHVHLVTLCKIPAQEVEQTCGLRETVETEKEAECVIAPRDGTLGKPHHTSLPLALSP